MSANKGNNNTNQRETRDSPIAGFQGKKANGHIY